MANTGDFHWSLKLERSTPKKSDTLIEDNERFYSSRLKLICESGRFESVLETLGNMEELQMVRKVFVDKMMEAIIEIADIVGYKSE